MAKTLKQLHAEAAAQKRLMLDKLREAETEIQALSDAAKKMQQEAQQKVAELQRNAPALIGYAQALREMLALPNPKNPARPLDK